MIVFSLFSPFSGTGVTHTAISLANALSKKGYKVCVVDRNEEHNDIKLLGVELGFIDEDEGDFFTHNKVDYILYSNRFSIASLRKENYDYVLLDCGTNLSDMCIQANQLICVSSSREWNRGRNSFYNICEELEDNVGLENVLFVFPFANNSAQKELKSFLDSKRIYFPSIEESPFNSTFDISYVDVFEEKKTSLIGSLRSNIDKTTLEKYKKDMDEMKNALNSKEKQIKETQSLIDSKEKEISSINKELLETQSEIDKQKKLTEQISSEYESKLTEKEQEIVFSQKELEVRKKAIEEEHYKATHDKLTGCKNRLGYTEDLIEYSIDNVTIVNFDVNNLKKTNDTLGHQFGDKLITTISNELCNHFENVYRMGGDEFTVLAKKGFLDISVLKEIDEVLKQYTKDDTNGIIYQVAYGYEDGNGSMSFEEIYHNADLKMYEDKAIKKASLISPEEKAKAEEMARLEEERRLEKQRLQELEDKRVKEELERQKLEIERIESEKRAEEERIRMEEERLRHEKEMEEERLKIEKERLEHEKVLEEERKRNEEERLRKEQEFLNEKLQKERELQEEKLRKEEELAKERLKLEEERIRKEKEEQKRLELEEKHRYEEALNNGLIPATKWEVNSDFEEQEFEKFLCTMWFVKDKISFVTNKGSYVEKTLYIYPTDFEQVLYSTPLIVVVEDGLEYKVYSDDLKVVINLYGYDFEISCRFQPNGKLQSNIYCPDVDVEQEIEVHNGIFTPRFFAKILCSEGNDFEVYPIKNNINGTCDCVLKLGDNLSYNHGEEMIENNHYRFYMNDKTFKVIVD